ncbi:testis-expressed protein 38 [Ornithorhynchus anatinus]|uniref:Testis expressed 38 n=1 Tax=Ornithorhynchus anatinus TaxID=9258 RepID=A0A6I8NBK5_ORNAN|nr:testis-expressed protein 38 [Ornithorhynchus anatinus]
MNIPGSAARQHSAHAASAVPAWSSLCFSLLGLLTLATGGCVFFLHWRKKVRREARARAWAATMRVATLSYSPLVYWINKRQRYGLDARLGAQRHGGGGRARGPREGRSPAPRPSAPHVAPPFTPIFEEIPSAPSLCTLPSVVDHSVSFPMDAVGPDKDPCFHSLPNLARGDWHPPP